MMSGRVEVLSVVVEVERTDVEVRQGILRESRRAATAYACELFGWSDARVTDVRSVRDRVAVLVVERRA